jgi:hypothetical protein
LVQSDLDRFTKEAVTLAKKAAVGNPKPAGQKGFGGDDDRVIVSIHGLETSLNPTHRRFLDVLKMPRTARILDLEVAQQPDFTTVCRGCES